MRLRDELFGPPPPPRAHVIVDFFPVKPDAIRLCLLGPSDIDFRFNPVRAGANDVMVLKAKRFGELVKRGVKPYEAAHTLHTTVRKIMDKPHTRAIVTEIVEGYALDAKVRALLIRAVQNKILIKADETGDTDTALAVMKQMMDDSELGMKGNSAAPPAPGIPQELKDLLNRTIPKELPPVDAEFSDVPPPAKDE